MASGDAASARPPATGPRPPHVDQVVGHEQKYHEAAGVGRQVEDVGEGEAGSAEEGEVDDGGHGPPFDDNEGGGGHGPHRGGADNHRRRPAEFPAPADRQEQADERQGQGAGTGQVERHRRAFGTASTGRLRLRCDGGLGGAVRRRGWNGPARLGGHLDDGLSADR